MLSAFFSFLEKIIAGNGDGKEKNLPEFINCECGAKVGISNSDVVSIGVGDPENRSWIHACVCSVCGRAYWYMTGRPVLTSEKEVTYSIGGRSARKNGKGFVFS